MEVDVSLIQSQPLFAWQRKISKQAGSNIMYDYVPRMSSSLHAQMSARDNLIGSR